MWGGPPPAEVGELDVERPRYWFDSGGEDIITHVYRAEPGSETFFYVGTHPDPWKYFFWDYVDKKLEWCKDTPFWQPKLAKRLTDEELAILARCII